MAKEFLKRVMIGRFDEGQKGLGLEVTDGEKVGEDRDLFKGSLGG